MLQQLYVLSDEAEAADHGERARMIREMHEGIGCHLLSLLILSRGDNRPGQIITLTVEQAIDDASQLIESLHSVGDTTDPALRQIPERAETKLCATGMRLICSDRIGGLSIIPPPGTIVAVYRIMQQTINNAVRHSGGKVVTVAITGPDSDGVETVTSDDGTHGLDFWKRGRGLSKMATHAQAIGAEFQLETGAGGTLVSLRLPANDHSNLSG